LGWLAAFFRWIMWAPKYYRERGEGWGIGSNKNKKRGGGVPELTEKQKRFVDEYLVDLNGTQAAIRAGYSPRTANNSYSILQRPQVQQYLRKRRNELQKKIEITAENIVAELAKIGFADIADFISIEEEINPETGIPFRYVAVKRTRDMPQAKRAAIAGIKQTSQGIEVKLYNKVEALELLGKHLGLFDKQDEASRMALKKLDSILSSIEQAMV